MPSQRRLMAQQTVAQQTISIRLVCRTFSISETCYPYYATLSDENTLIAEQLIKPTEEDTDWGIWFVFLLSTSC